MPEHRHEILIWLEGWKPRRPEHQQKWSEFMARTAKALAAITEDLADRDAAIADLKTQLATAQANALDAADITALTAEEQRESNEAAAASDASNAAANPGATLPA